MRSKVSILKTKPKTVIEDYKKLLSLAEFDKALDKSKTTIIKDNISWHIPYPSANTTPWQLEGVIQWLLDNGYKNLVTVHNNTVVTNPFKGSKLNKHHEIYKKYNITEKYNFRKSDIKWIEYVPTGEMSVLNNIYKKIRIPEYFFEKNIIHLPTMKTHIYTTTTGAMKNAFGGLLNTKRHYTHSYIHKTLVDLLKIQQEIHTGIGAVMDGTAAGSGPGPRTLIPHIKNYILASTDSVAIDAVSAKMMGFDPLKIEYINESDKQGFGTGNISEIEIIGENIENINFEFEVGDNFASFFGDLLWFSPLKIFQKILFHTPVVYLFVIASATYHDYIWYPCVGRKVFREYLKTEWGKLFTEYK